MQATPPPSKIWPRWYFAGPERWRAASFERSVRPWKPLLWQRQSCCWIPDTPLLERAPGSRESGGWSAFWPTGCSAGREQCGAVWSKAAGSSDTLTYDKAGPYVTNMQAADPDNDGKFTKSEFMEACKKGLVQAGQQARRNRRRSNAWKTY